MEVSEVFGLPDHPQERQGNCAENQGCHRGAYKEGEANLKGNGRTARRLLAEDSLRDGDIDRPDDPAYENAFFINAN